MISGGADDLLANAGDRARPGHDARRRRPVPAIAKDATGNNVPIVTTQGEYRYVGRLTVDVRLRGPADRTDMRRPARSA